MTSDAARTMPAPDTQANASVGQRVGATLLDGLLVMLPLGIVAAILAGTTQTGGGRAAFTLSGVPLLVTVLVALAYYVVCESVAGQTLGKKLVHIRVVPDQGGTLGVGAVLVRTLLRLVDGFAFYLVGFVTALISAKNQRLGDMAASTRVVTTR